MFREKLASSASVFLSYPILLPFVYICNINVTLLVKLNYLFFIFAIFSESDLYWRLKFLSKICIDLHALFFHLRQCSIHNVELFTNYHNFFRFAHSSGVFCVVNKTHNFNEKDTLFG